MSPQPERPFSLAIQTIDFSIAASPWTPPGRRGERAGRFGGVAAQRRKSDIARPAKEPLLPHHSSRCALPSGRSGNRAGRNRGDGRRNSRSRPAPNLHQSLVPPTTPPFPHYAERGFSID